MIELPTMQLCSGAEVFASPTFDDASRRGGAGRPTEVDTFVDLLCRSVSEQFERETGRWVERQEYTQVFPAEDGRGLLALRAYPVVSISEVREAYDGNFAGGTVRDARSYQLLREGATGLLKVRIGYAAFMGDVQVTYTGGLATVEGTLPAQVVQGAIEQVCFAYKRAPTSHLSGASQGQGAATYYRTVPTLDSWRAVIDTYRRVTWR